MVERAKDKEKIEIGKRIIAFIGPEGAGKSLQAKFLAQELNLPYISTRQLLEDRRDNDMGPIGDKVRKMFDDGVYLDGETLLEIVVERFSQEDTEGGFILDGGFRTVEETVEFRNTLTLAGRDFPVVVFYLKVPKEVSIERLINGPNARKRHDDTPEGLEKRLSKFNYRLEERLAAIRAQEDWQIIEIDATPTEDKVSKVIMESTKNLQ